jgi:hypothetical protein
MATDLKDIRDAFAEDQRQWQPIRDEGAKDMLMATGQVWEALDPAGLAARKETKRPALNLDELSQYANQLVNEVRANKRAIKVTPLGQGADDKTADLRQNLIRQIEYRSNSQTAYTTMFDGAVHRGYGFLRIKAQYVAEPNPNDPLPSDFDQELLIDGIPNPDLVTPDANSVKQDGSDMRRCTLYQVLPKADFRHRFGAKAKIANFEAGQVAAPGWFPGDQVMVAEHWRIDTTLRKLLLVEGAGGVVPMFSEDYDPKRIKGTVKREREVESPRVRQYFCNGVEILEQTTWPGRYIPVVSCFGKVIYLNQAGDASTRMLLSLTRLARDPVLFYCYIRTCEAEAIGGVPRATSIGYEGQFAGHENEWQKANREPVAYLEVKATTQDTGGVTVLPLPQRQSWDPPLQNLEIAAESARRAIQAAIGSTPLPTQAQRRNEKSGVALKQIEMVQQKGQFHYIDHYEESISRVGVILEDLLPHYYDTARDVTIRKPDDQTTSVRINDPEDQQSVWLKKDGAPVGVHDVTISTGPSHDSEREAASDFADSIAQNPQIFPTIADLVVRLKNLGPIGDEIAERLTPPQFKQPKDGEEPDPKALAQESAQLKEQLGQAEQVMGQLKQELDTQAAKQQADIRKAEIDRDTRIEVQRMQDATSIAVAQINASTKIGLAQDAAQMKAIAIDATAQEAEASRQHDAQMAERQHAQSLEAGAADVEGKAALADQSGQQKAQQQEMAGEQAMAMAEKQAEMAAQQANQETE